MSLEEALEALQRELAYNRYLYAQLLESETKRHQQARVIAEAKAQTVGILDWCRGRQHSFAMDSEDAEC